MQKKMIWDRLPGLGPREGFRVSQPPCGLSLGDAFQFPKEDLAGAVRVQEKHKLIKMEGKGKGQEPCKDWG